MTIVTLYKTRTLDDPAANNIMSALKTRGYDVPFVKIENVMRVQGELEPSAVEQFRQLFGNPVIETITTESMLNQEVGGVVEISYKPAWTDPEMSSAMRTFEALGVSGVTWVRLATRYQIGGISQVMAETVAPEVLRFNSQIKTFVREPWTTLIPSGDPGGVELFDIRSLLDDDLIKLFSDRRMHATREQMWAMRDIFRKFDRPATDLELELLTGRWSDHCDHTTLKALGLWADLKQTVKRINHPLVVSALVGNAGAMAFYDGWVLIFKGETHISPTFAGDPYGGIMTKHGGVIRDIIFMALGGWPIAGSTIMAIADPRMPALAVPAGAFHPQFVLKESIRGTFDYTNPMGIPMGCSEYLVHPRNIKGFALGHSVGIMPQDKVSNAGAKPGDLVILIGGLTGADGIHGATVSSAASTAETSTLDAAHVQIGAPIEERTFMEAMGELRDADCVNDCTDCGALGLGSALGELGERCGVWFNTAWVPLKCATLRPYEVVISESQERGVLAVPWRKYPQALQICRKYQVSADIIGMFTDSGAFQVVHDPSIDFLQWINNPQALMTGEVAADLPYDQIENTALPHIEVRERKRQLTEPIVQVPRTSAEWIAMVARHLSHFNIADQSEIAHRYDQTVQGNTVIPYIGGINENMQDDLSVFAPLRGKPYGCGMANSVNQFYGEIDSAGMGKLVYVDAITRLVAAGFAPSDITTCVNLYTPKVTDSPENAFDLIQLVRHGYLSASEELGIPNLPGRFSGIPVITGKDSSSGTFFTADGGRIDAPLTVDVLAVGRCFNAARLVPKQFRKSGDRIVVYVPGNSGELTLGGSVFLDTLGQRGDRLPGLDMDNVRYGLERYHELLQSRTVHSRSAIGTGGMIRRLFECCLGSGLGCKIDFSSGFNPLLWLFAELCGSIVYTDSDDSDFAGFNSFVLGEVTQEAAISVSHDNQQLFSASLNELGAGWKRTVTEVL